MRIRDIEFDEKTLKGVITHRLNFTNIQPKECIRWWVDLFFEVMDDFDFCEQYSKTVQYTDFDFKGIDELDNYIETLKIELNVIVKQNERDNRPKGK